MPRIGRSIPVRGFDSQGPFIGPYHPILTAAAPFIAPPVSVNLLTVDRIGRRHRRHNLTWWVNPPPTNPPPLAVVTTPGQLVVKTYLVAATTRTSRGQRVFPTVEAAQEQQFAAANPFPRTGLLDAFNYAGPGGITIAPSWSGPLGGFASNLRVGDVFANTINASASACSSWFNQEQYGPDCEFYADIVRADTGTSVIRLLARVQNPGSTTLRNNYDVNVTGAGTWTIARTLNNARVVLATFTQAVVIGDKFGISCVGSVISAWWFNSATGAWVLVGTASDSNITTAGFGAIEIQGSVNPSVWVLDNYGGGTLAPSGLVGLQRKPFLGPRPPLVVLPTPTLRQQTVTVATTAVARVAADYRRRAHSTLSPPATLAGAAFVAPPIQASLADNRIHGLGRRHFPTSFLYPPAALQVFARPLVSLTRIRPRPIQHAFAAPPVVTVVAPFVAPPVSVTTADNRIHGIGRRFPHSQLQPPFFYPQTSEILVALARTRPRATAQRLTAVSYPQISEIQVTLVRIRPRPTARLLTSVSYPQTSTIGTSLVQTRPRVTLHRPVGPAAIELIPSIEQLEDTIRASLAHTRPRPTTHKQIAPVVLPATSEIAVSLTRIRPRPTQRLLTSISYPASSEIAATLAKIRPRPTVTRFVAPAAVEFIPSVVQREDTIAVALARIRPRPTAKRYVAPVVLPQTSEITVQLARVRPRPTSRLLGPLIFYPQTTVIRTQLARTRPRPTRKLLAAPAVLAAAAQVFAGPTRWLVQSRPRRTRSFLTAVSYPQTSAIRVWLIRARPRPTIRLLTAVSYPQTSVIRTALVRIRPRPTKRLLTAVSYPATSVIRTALVRIRPRPTITRFIAPAAVEFVPAVVQREDTIGVSLARIRPRPTTRRFVAPLVYPQTSMIAVHLARTRPRPTTRLLTAVSYPQIGRLAVHLARVRPRPTTRLLTAVRYPATSAIRTALTQARPRPTSKRLTLTAIERVPAVEQLEDTVRVSLTRTRPRPTSRALYAPTALQTFAGPVTAVTRGRPRPTTKALAPPEVVRVPSVELREDTILVQAARIRPRPTTKLLNAPAALQVFAGPLVALTRIRPRPTTRILRAPTVVRVPSVEQAEQTTRTALVHTRPRPTRKQIAPPTVERVPSVEQREDTIRVALIQTRPRPTRRKLAAPTVVIVNPPVVTTLLVRLALRVPVESPRRRPHWKLGPPTKVLPLPTQQVQTVGAHLVRIKPRLTTRRLTPLIFYPQTTRIAAHLVRIRPQPTRRLITRIVYSQTSEILVSLVRTRPRPTGRLLTAVSYPAVSEITVSLARIRPRPTTKWLTLTAVERIPSVELREDTITTSLVRTRPRPTTERLAAPTRLRTFAGPVIHLARIRPQSTARLLTALAYPQAGRVAVHLTRIRPRATIHRLTLTAIERIPAVEQREDTIATSLVRTRPRPTRKLLTGPTALRTFAAAAVHIARIRPRPTSRQLLAPVALAQPLARPIATALTRVRPQPTTKRFEAPQAVRRPAVEQRIRVTLARIRAPQKSATLRRPVTLETFAAGVPNLVRVRSPRTMSLLRPPTAVTPPAPPTLQQQTILALLVRVDLRRRRPTLVQPRPVPFVVPGFTCGYPIGAAAVAGADVGLAAAEGSDVSGAAAESTDVGSAAAESETIPAAVAEILDQQGGLPT